MTLVKLCHLLKEHGDGDGRAGGEWHKASSKARALLLLRLHHWFQAPHGAWHRRCPINVAKLSVTMELAELFGSRPGASGRCSPHPSRRSGPATRGRNSPMWRRRARGFCREACEVEAWACREPTGPAPSLGRTQPLRGCPAQPRPTSLAALTVVVTRPGLVTGFWWASLWGGLGLWHPLVQGADALGGVVPFPGGGG